MSSTRYSKTAAKALVQRAAAAAAKIVASGYELRMVEFCENSDTPGILGVIAGVTDHDKKLVRIATHRRRDAAGIVDILEHELHHVLDPAWDCGNRDSFGRGAPKQTVPGGMTMPTKEPYRDHGPAPADAVEDDRAGAGGKVVAP
jgi:hypothetical protein